LLSPFAFGYIQCQLLSYVIILVIIILLCILILFDLFWKGRRYESHALFLSLHFISICMGHLLKAPFYSLLCSITTLVKGIKKDWQNGSSSTEPA
jgi:hypothetical protein